MATKHLYIIEDVAATMLYALQKGDHQLAKSCIAELFDSGEQEHAWKILTFAYMLQEPHQLSYEPLIQQNVEATLKAFHKPFGIPAIEPITHIKPPTTNLEIIPEFPWLTYPASWTKGQAYVLWRTVTVSLEKGHWEKAYRLINPLLFEHSAAVASLLKALQLEFMAKLLESTVFMPLAIRVLKHALYSKTLTPKPVATSKSNIRAEGRAFCISNKALKIWRLNPKPITDLQGCPTLIMDENASNYWKEAVKQFAITGKKTLKFTTDDDLERFYTTHFPNDIPDEWSNEERYKSHGFAQCLEHYENPWVPAFILL